jgi:hypothetical protein
MTPPPVDLRESKWARPEYAGRAFLVIRHGVRGTAMAGWPMLSAGQTWELVAHIGSRNDH